MTPWFNARKAAQVAAFFVREEGGSINVLKLVKLVYIADRRNMERFDFPITGDNLVSMDHGPVNSITLNCINGLEVDRGDWEAYLGSRKDYEIGLAREPISDDDLDELSDAELSTLRLVWTDLGHMSHYKIRDWTHDHCPEWEYPNGSSAAIPFSRVFKFLGKQHPEELEKQIKANRNLRQVFA